MKRFSSRILNRRKSVVVLIGTTLSILVEMEVLCSTTRERFANSLYKKLKPPHCRCLRSRYRNRLHILFARTIRSRRIIMRSVGTYLTFKKPQLQVCFCLSILYTSDSLMSISFTQHDAAECYYRSSSWNSLLPKGQQKPRSDRLYILPADVWLVPNFLMQRYLS